MLKNHDIGQMSEEEKREQQFWSQINLNFRGLIITAIRYAGNNDIGDDLMDRVNAVKKVAYKFESQKSSEEAVPALVQLQLESESNTEFISRVREQFADVIMHENEADED